MDELSFFNTSMDDESALLPGSSAQAAAPLFHRGDRVEVREGDLINLQGTVLSVDNNSVKIQPDHEDLTVGSLERGKRREVVC